MIAANQAHQKRQLNNLPLYFGMPRNIGHHKAVDGVEFQQQKEVRIQLVSE